MRFYQESLKLLGRLGYAVGSSQQSLAGSSGIAAATAVEVRQHALPS
jgi:hypothetical protein